MGIGPGMWKAPEMRLQEQESRGEATEANWGWTWGGASCP